MAQCRCINPRLTKREEQKRSDNGKEAEWTQRQSRTREQVQVEEAVTQDRVAVYLFDWIRGSFILRYRHFPRV